MTDPLESLKAVLCDPEGRVCIAGSDGDRRVIQDALAALTYERAKQAEPVCKKCKGTGMQDSGGFYPWGESIDVPCDCQAAPPAAQKVEPVLLNLALRLRLARRCLKQAISSGANQSYIDQLRGAETEAWNSFQAAKAIAAPPAVQGPWEETARQYAENARFWREKYEATQQQAEPVAWRYENLHTGAVSLMQERSSSGCFTLSERTYIETPLYAAPPADDEAVRLLESARLIIEKLRAFGNDNVHKYDVPQFLAAIDAYLARVSHA